MAYDELPENEWKREVHTYIDKQIDAHNTANQEEFKRLRDGQLKLESDIAAVLDASATAHSEIISRLDRLERKLD